MLCRYCASDNSATNVYCNGCGKPLWLVCSACGHVNGPRSAFCGACSQPLGASPATLPVEQALHALGRTGGERKHLTLLFADIANSTGLIEQTDPEDAIRRINPVIDAMKAAVESHDGIVTHVLGDGIVALFGAPHPHEDHALRACAAAIAMQAAVNEIGDAQMRIRIGLHTGLVVVRAVRSGSGTPNYDAAGPAMHLAARMEQTAEAGAILLTADTVAATRQSIEFVPLGMRSVRGLSEPVETFRLVGVRNAPASAIFRSRPQLSSLAGRAIELASLDVELASVAAGEARVVGVVGGAGVGKSRLCFDFAERCRGRGVAVREIRVLAHGSATPYQPVLELLRDYFGIEAVQSADEARRQVTERFASLPLSADSLPLLLDFLGLLGAGNRAPRLDPAVRKMRLMDLVAAVVRAGPRDEPAVIMVEDLHWIDAASGEFIETMVDAAVGTKTLLLFNFRTDYTAAWMRRSHYRQIALPPLAPADAQRMLDELLGADASLAALRNDIGDCARGNPFFIEELVHTLLERGHLEGGRGACRLVRAVGAIPLPRTIEAVLTARIDRLDEAARHVLQCAAVVGREASRAILESVSGLPSTVLADALRALRRSELLRELWLGRPGLFAFSHPLIQAVCYQSLLRERRKQIHADVARALKAASGEPWEERANKLAHHLEEAGDVMEAAQAAMRSALWIGTHDSRAALGTWKKVHQLLAQLPETDSTNWLRINTCLQIMGFGWREGLPIEEAGERFEEARGLAVASNNHRANAWAHAAYGRNLAVTGSADDYVARIREATAIAIEARDASTEVMLKATLSHALRLAGRLDAALAANIEATERVHEMNEFDRQLLGFSVERWLTAMRGQILVLLGRFDHARPYLDRLLQDDVDPYDITQHLASVAYTDLAWGEGDLALARQHAERASSLATSSGSPYVQVSAQTCRGISRLVSGEFAAAADELRSALDFARSRRAGLETEARLLADLAHAYRLEGNLDAAMRTAQEAIQVAGRRVARIPECLARIVLAEVNLARGDVGAASRELPRVRALMEETGARLYQPLLNEFAAGVERARRSAGARPG